MTISLHEVGRQARVSRKPQHTFHLRHRPWQIQPFMIAPVLPGETLRNLLHQSRVVTDPIKNPLIGWWIEYYWFYVKHRDLAESEAFQEMMLDPAWSPDAVDDPTASVPLYHFGGTGTINWTSACLDRVTEVFFRNDGEAVSAAVVDTLPLASVTGNSWFDTVIRDADFVLPDVDVDLNADSTITASEVEMARRQYELLRHNQLTTMTYEEYLQTYGVRPTKAELHEPELIRFARNWSYPTNTVDAATGAPSSAVSWAVAERADKDRFFKEPGFIFGVTVARPKVYFSKQAGSAVGMLNNVYSWLPAVLSADPYTSVRKFAGGTGPLQDTDEGAGDLAYWVDVKDLFLYGDQFLNFALTETDAGLVALPAANLQRRYVSETDIDALFVTPATAGKVRQDGICSLTIAGRQVDTSPTS